MEQISNTSNRLALVNNKSKGLNVEEQAECIASMVPIIQQGEKDLQLCVTYREDENTSNFKEIKKTIQYIALIQDQIRPVQYEALMNLGHIMRNFDAYLQRGPDANYNPDNEFGPYLRALVRAIDHLGIRQAELESHAEALKHKELEIKGDNQGEINQMKAEFISICSHYTNLVQELQEQENLLNGNQYQQKKYEQDLQIIQNNLATTENGIKLKRETILKCDEGSKEIEIQMIEEVKKEDNELHMQEKEMGVEAIMNIRAETKKSDQFLKTLTDKLKKVKAEKSKYIVQGMNVNSEQKLKDTHIIILIEKSRFMNTPASKDSSWLPSIFCSKKTNFELTIQMLEKMMNERPQLDHPQTETYTVIVMGSTSKILFTRLPPQEASKKLTEQVKDLCITEDLNIQEGLEQVASLIRDTRKSNALVFYIGSGLEIGDIKRQETLSTAERIGKSQAFQNGHAVFNCIIHGDQNDMDHLQKIALAANGNKDYVLVAGVKHKTIYDPKEQELELSQTISQLVEKEKSTDLVFLDQQIEALNKQLQEEKDHRQQISQTLIESQQITVAHTIQLREIKSHQNMFALQHQLDQLKKQKTTYVEDLQILEQRQERLTSQYRDLKFNSQKCSDLVQIQRLIDQSKAQISEQQQKKTDKEKQMREYIQKNPENGVFQDLGHQVSQKILAWQCFLSKFKGDIQKLVTFYSGVIVSFKKVLDNLNNIVPCINMYTFNDVLKSLFEYAQSHDSDLKQRIKQASDLNDPVKLTDALSLLNGYSPKDSNYQQLLFILQRISLEVVIPLTGQTENDINDNCNTQIRKALQMELSHHTTQRNILISDNQNLRIEISQVVEANETLDRQIKKDFELTKAIAKAQNQSKKKTAEKYLNDDIKYFEQRYEEAKEELEYLNKKLVGFERTLSEACGNNQSQDETAFYEQSIERTRKLIEAKADTCTDLKVTLTQRQEDLKEQELSTLTIRSVEDIAAQIEKNKAKFEGNEKLIDEKEAQITANAQQLNIEQTAIKKIECENEGKISGWELLIQKVRKSVVNQMSKFKFEVIKRRFDDIKLLIKAELSDDLTSLNQSLNQRPTRYQMVQAINKGALLAIQNGPQESTMNPNLGKRHMIANPHDGRISQNPSSSKRQKVSDYDLD